MISEKLFIDSDVLLDLFFDRRPYSQFTEKLFDIDLRNKFSLYTSSLVAANLHYIISKQRNKKYASDCLETVLKFITILPLEGEAIQFGLRGEFDDFEDGIQYFTAKKNGCTAILSRNIKDYKHSSITVLSPEGYFKS